MRERDRERENGDGYKGDEKRGAKGFFFLESREDIRVWDRQEVCDSRTEEEEAFVF